MAQLLSVNVGLPREVEWKGRTSGQSNGSACHPAGIRWPRPFLI